MRCPLCDSDSTRVVDSRLTEPGDAVRRRRSCDGCGSRFTTYERAAGVSLAVRKRDGRLEPFDREKLLRGLMRAATKRPVEVPALEAIADSITAAVRRAGGEASAEAVGELALRGLIAVDRVAAIRFASVYRNFEDLGEFEAELRRLEAEPVAAAGQLPFEEPREAGDPSEPGARIHRPSAPRKRAGEQASRSTERQRRGHVEHP